MPYKVLDFQPTPNPNALKCTVQPRLPDPPRSFRSAADVGQDAFARALFDVPGVTSLLLSGEWMTINKAPEAEWGAVKRGVQAVMARL